MKRKRIFIFLGIIVILTILALILFLCLRKKDTSIEIFFNSDGGTTIEKLNINKGESITLPITTKEGFTFVGWFDGDYKVSNSTKFNENTTLYAKWIKENAKTYIITFDSDGGNVIDDLIVECETELKLPANPIKSGYEFVAWVDKNETPILDKALLACENITLKATWKKIEEKKTETKKETKTETKQTETVKEITYTCPDGYTLNGVKCTLTKDATSGCDIQHEKEIGGKCYSVRSYKSPVCRVQTGVNPGSYTPILHEGTVYKESSGWACYYQQSTSNTCDSSKKIMGVCYDYVQHNGPDFNPCSEAGDGYEYLIGNALYGTVEKGYGASTGCYKPTDKHYLCEEGYTLANNKCTKTIDATAN